MKKIVLWQIIVNMMTLAAFFIGYRIGGPNIAVGAAIITTFAFVFITALAVTTDAIGAAAIAIVATLVVTTDAIGAAAVAIFIIFIVAVAGMRETNSKVTFPQLLGSYVAEAAALYGIMAGFLHGMVLSVWLPTLIAAIVSAILFGVVPAIRLRARIRRTRLEKRASKLRIALEEEPSCSYRIQAESEDRQALEAELEALEAELATIKAESLT